MKKLIKPLFIFFLALFSIVFLFMLGKGISSSNDPFTKDAFLISIIAVPFFILLLQRLMPKLKTPINTNTFTILFFLTVLAVNIVLSLKLNNLIQPVSDFDLAYNKAIKFFTDTQYDPYYPWWTNFSILLSIIFRFFGSNLAVVAIFNSIFSTLSCFLVYSIAKKHLGFKSFWPLLPAALFAFYPSRLFFLPFVTPDFIVEFGFILTSYLFFNYLDLFNEKAFTKRTYFYPILISASVFFFSLFKPVQAIFFVLFAIILAIKSLSAFPVSIKKTAYFLAVFLCVSICSNFLHVKAFESYTHIRIDKSLVLMNKLYVGLNSEGRGYWHPKNEEYRKQLELEHGSDTTKIKQAIKDKLIKDIKNNQAFPGMIMKKLDTAFISDFYGIEWLNVSLKSGHISLNNLARLTHLSNLYYYFILFFALIAVIDILVTKSPKKLYFIILLLGFMAVVLIGESQTRYKLAFLFNFIFLASLGLRFAIEYPIEQKIQKFLK